MCGFVAVIAAPGRFSAEDVQRATARLSHRGPDARGVERVHRDDRHELWLGFARLAIVDLSPLGSQPMHAGELGQGGWIVFNGEIYNHRSLRGTLPDPATQSRTDTEVLLRGLLSDGLDFLHRTNGMFAFVAFDERARRVLVARDRLGKKPLYVYEANGVLAFASELKAFAALGLPLTVDEEAFAYYRWLGYVPAERSVYRECRKFPAGSHASIELASERTAVAPRLFWDPLRAMGTRFPGGYEDAVDELWTLLRDAVRLRLEADVPVGVFLSGGIDSSLVAAAARDHTSSVNAYVVKPSDPALDESTIAMGTAQRLGMEARVLALGPSDYDTQMNRLAWHYDEPMADLSQIAVMANAEAARREITVVLTGDGGDEAFLGYPWAQHPARLFRLASYLGRVPGGRTALRQLLDTPIGYASMRVGAQLLHLNTRTVASKIELLKSTLAAKRAADIYEHFHANHVRSELSAADAHEIGERTLLEHVKSWYPAYDWAAAEARDVAELVAAVDLVTYMRDDILVKVDRGTMAYGVEARSPLLDHRIVELALSLPIHFKAHAGVTKRILRDLCARRVDQRLASLPKRGFGIAQPWAGSSASPPAAWNGIVERLWRERWTAAASANGASATPAAVA